MAFGLNISVSRLGSVWNSNTVPSNLEKHGLGFTLFVGFCICLFSLANAFGMAILDKFNEKKTKEKAAAEPQDAGGDNAEEEFKFRDILSFKLPFWLLTISCVVTYMSIFPYIQIVSDLVQRRNKIDP